MIYILAIPGSPNDMSELRVLQWHVSAGDSVVKNQLLVELETHKAIIEVRADQSAVMRSRLCAEGEWGPPGRSLGILSDVLGEDVPDEHGMPLAATFEIC